LRQELFYLDIGPQVNTNGHKLLLAAAVLVFYTTMSQLFQHNARRLRLSNLFFSAAASYLGILGISGAYILPALF